MDLELRHLKIVRAVADAGSLTRAATGLGLAQPALSAQLKRIERALGGELFVRGREGVRATALGEMVLERARVVLPAVCELQEEALRFARQGAAGYRLGGTHGPLLGGLVDRLARADPGAAVTTYTSWSEKEVAGSVAAGRLDFALVGVCGESAPPEPGRLAWREVARDPVYVMLAEDHPLAAAPRGGIELAELAAEAWTDVPGDGCFGDCFAAACVRAGFTPACVYETDTASCVHLVQVGRAVGLCRATFPPTPGVVTRPLAGTPLVWRHLLGWHPAGRAAGRAAGVLAHARAAHAGALARAGGLAGRGGTLPAPPQAGRVPVPLPVPGASASASASAEPTTAWSSASAPKPA
ncbi:LysR family transcriptional regulator [Streptomyces sp. NPDC003038]|uniref:LysR substrate-binding domain-containing protein n=1 Tax=unclassified Streptomyces TaxID=2593676 RepID=UPI0033A0B662